MRIRGQDRGGERGEVKRERRVHKAVHEVPSSALNLLSKEGMYIVPVLGSNPGISKVHELK